MPRRDNFPRISIVTVCRNAVDVLAATMQSVLAQSYPNIEYIIIDGASTDGTVDLIKEYENQLTHWRSEADEGIYAAMNKGIQQASGEWINFMNAGDIFHDEHAVEKILAEAKAETYLLYCDVYLRQADGKLKVRQHKPLYQAGLYHNICHQATFYRLEKIGKFQFDTQYKVSADFDFLLQAIHQNKQKYQHIPQPLIVYQGGGWSDKFAYQALSEREQQFQKIKHPIIRRWNQWNLRRQQIKLRQEEKKEGKALILALSLGRYGGCVRYATEIIDALNLPCDTYISTFTTEKKPQNSRTVWTYKNRFQFVLNSLFVLPFLWFKIMWDAWRKSYSAVYFPYKHFWNLPFLWGFKWLGRKTVMTIHDGFLHDGDGNKLEQWLVRKCVQQADELIFLTDFVQKEVQENIGFKAKSSVIEHGMFDMYVRREARTHSPKPRLLFLGRIGKYKGVDMLIEAVNQLPQDSYEQLCIAGKMWYDLKVDTTNAKLKIQDKWLEEQEMTDLLRSHDILILPYKAASQSGVVMMGVAAAIPMICTKVGGLQEQLSETEALFVEPNVAALREGILQLINDPLLYQNISEQLLRKQEDLSWKNIARRIEGVLQK